MPAATALLALLVASCGGSTPTTTLAASTTTRVLYYQVGVSAGPSLVTRADGSILEERRYEPFGGAIDAYRELEGGGGQVGPIDPVADPHNALNKQTDPATGWSDHGARWMAPETGRWLTPDPPVKAPDPDFMVSPWALHPYQYVDQNPVLFWDPDGKDNIVVSIISKGYRLGKGVAAENDFVQAGHVATVFMPTVPALFVGGWLSAIDSMLQQRARDRAVRQAEAELRSLKLGLHIGTTIAQHARDTGAHVLTYTPDQANRIAAATKGILDMGWAAGSRLDPEHNWDQLETRFDLYRTRGDYLLDLNKADDLFNELDDALRGGTPITSTNGEPVCDGDTTLVEVRGLAPRTMGPHPRGHDEEKPIYFGTSGWGMGVPIAPTSEPE